MAKAFEGTPQEFGMDGYLKDNLDAAKKVIKDDWDMLFVIDGAEGSGKSTLAAQMAFYCDPTLTLARYCFSPGKFKQAIMEAEQYQSVVYDEAHSGLNSRATMSLINRTLVSMLTEIRQKNLFVFILLPTFFDLDRYVAIWRSRALIHVYTGKGLERGYLSFYNDINKKRLYLLGKKLYKYGVIKPNFIGRFGKHFPLDAVEYKRLKLQALVSKDKPASSKELEREHRRWLWERLKEHGQDVKVKHKIALLGITEVTYYRWIKDEAAMKVEDS